MNRVHQKFLLIPFRQYLIRYQLQWYWLPCPEFKVKENKHRLLKFIASCYSPQSGEDTHPRTNHLLFKEGLHGVLYSQLLVNILAISQLWVKIWAISQLLNLSDLSYPCWRLMTKEHYSQRLVRGALSWAWLLREDKTQRTNFNCISVGTKWCCSFITKSCVYTGAIWGELTWVTHSQGFDFESKKSGRIFRILPVSWENVKT